MPYFIQKRGGQYCVVKGTKGNPGETKKCHTKRQDALDHMAALHVHVEDAGKEKAATASNSASNLPHGSGSQFGATASALERDKDTDDKPSKCTCPKCKATATSKKGESCSATKCPKCGAKMKDKKAADDKTTEIAIKALGNGRIGGYLVKWGSAEEKDLVGEFFTAKTNFWLDRWNRRPLMYQHGLDPALKGNDAVVGVVDDYDIDEIGLWIVAQLDARHRYKEAIENLVEQKALNLSSGALPRFVERTPDGFIKTWPIVEVSLTPTPAEYRLADVTVVKAAFETIGETFEEVNTMEDEKTIWQKFAKKLGFADQVEPEPMGGGGNDQATPVASPPEKGQVEGDKVETPTPLPEFILDESAVKAISERVASTMTDALKPILDEVIVPLQTELNELKARIEANEKTIHDKAMEIVNSLPPIVKVRATETEALETEDKPDEAPKQIDSQTNDQIAEWAQVFADIVQRGLTQTRGPESI